MDYEKTQPGCRDGRKALDLAAQAFTNSGFRISSFTDNRLEVEGPAMRSNHESPMRGVSRAVVTSGGNSVSLSAEFGASRRFAINLIAFILALGVALGLTFTILAPQMSFRPATEHPRKLLWMITALPLAPWVILIPVIRRASRRRLERELDTLLNNMAMVAG